MVAEQGNSLLAKVYVLSKSESKKEQHTQEGILGRQNSTPPPTASSSPLPLPPPPHTHKKLTKMPILTPLVCMGGGGGRETLFLYISAKMGYLSLPKDGGSDLSS